MGLYAKAEAYLAAEQVATAKRQKRQGKLRHCLIGLTLGLALPTLTCTNNFNDLTSEITPDSDTTLTTAVTEFQTGLTSHISIAEREMLAKMVYGEAGRGADPFEVIHTVLNRMSSPLFKDDMASIITQKGQYVGYNPVNPVTNDYLKMVDIAISDWELNGCQPIKDCDHYYFITGVRGICNRFEISEDHQGLWVDEPQKKYAKLGHYCPTAKAEAKRFFSERERN